MPISDILLDEGGAFYNVKAAQFGAVGDGTTNDRQAFVDAGAEGHILVPAGTYRINSSLAISRAIRFVDGAVLRPANGATVTLDGPVEAGPYKIFDLSLNGTVAFGSNSAEQVYPEWWGAVGDGSAVNATVDTNAIRAAIAAAGEINGGAVVFQPNGRYRCLGTIYGAPNVHWQCNNAALIADPSGTFDDVRDVNGDPTGFEVLLASDNGQGSSHVGILRLQGNNIANLCGISGASAATSPVKRGSQTWEHLRIENFARGIYAINQQGQGGNTIVGHHFTYVRFGGCDYEMYFVGNGSDDVVFDVVRGQTQTGNAAHVYLEDARGVVINSLFVNNGGNNPGVPADADGIVLVNDASLVCAHVYLEGQFRFPISVTGDNGNLWIGDLKGAAKLESVNGQVIDIHKGANSCSVNVKFDAEITGNDPGGGNITHLVRLNASGAQTYGRQVTLWAPFPTSSKTPVIYASSDGSSSYRDNVVAYAKCGVFRYTYNGSTTTERRYALVNGGTVAATTSVGNLVRKMEVFDETGASLGFVPIYDAIT